MNFSKNQICVSIKSQKELMKAINVLKQNGEDFHGNACFKSLLFNDLHYVSDLKKWIIGFSVKKSVTLKELEKILKK